jgi:lipopolysaccharide export system permease protein
MKQIGLMITKMVLIRFLVIVFGISVFVLTLEVIAYVNEILAIHDRALWGLGEYALMRLPSVLSTFIGMSMLLALLLTLSELSYRGELVSIWSSGVSPVRLMVMLMPLGIILGAANFFLNDKAIPAAEPYLQEWGIGDYGAKKLKVSEKDPIWMRSGADILRAERSNAKSTMLEGVTIFRRDRQGHLSEQIMAERAELNGDRWELSNVIIYYRQNLPASRLSKMIYSGALKPAAAGARSGAPEAMSLKRLDRFIQNAGFGIRPPHVYETWWHKRISLIFSALLMVAICVPLAVKFRRGGGIGVMFAIGVLMGFALFVLDGISVTLGELGVLPPWMAVWLPIMIFFGIGTYNTLRAETII